MGVIDELVQGSIDMHVHMAPDPDRERRVDAIELAVQAKEAGMRGVVMKSHSYPTSPIVYAASQFVKDIDLFGSLSLDYEVGGLNPAAVEVAGRLGSKVVWMPTFSARGNRADRGITVFDENGRLLPVVNEIMELVKKYDMVLGTGHLSGEEIFAVIDAARTTGIEKVVVTHASSRLVAFGVEEQVEAARRGAFIEHCTLTLMPTGERMDPQAMAEGVKAVGAERTILSTDFGQATNPLPPEGMRIMVAAMLSCGLSREQLETMVKANPAQLLGLR